MTRVHNLHENVIQIACNASVLESQAGVPDRRTSVRHPPSLRQTAVPTILLERYQHELLGGRESEWGLAALGIFWLYRVLPACIS